MSEYKKTALVLGAGGFIGSHMVKRLRSEGYWVRGVDLKYPEFSDTEANEFVQGDLRDVEFVRRVIQYKGEQGNFYNEVPYRYILPFSSFINLCCSNTLRLMVTEFCMMSASFSPVNTNPAPPISAAN